MVCCLSKHQKSKKIKTLDYVCNSERSRMRGMVGPGLAREQCLHADQGEDAGREDGGQGEAEASDCARGSVSDTFGGDLEV